VFTNIINDVKRWTRSAIYIITQFKVLLYRLLLVCGWRHFEAWHRQNVPEVWRHFLQADLYDPVMTLLTSVCLAYHLGTKPYLRILCYSPSRLPCYWNGEGSYILKFRMKIVLYFINTKGLPSCQICVN